MPRAFAFLRRISAGALSATGLSSQAATRTMAARAAPLSTTRPSRSRAQASGCRSRLRSSPISVFSGLNFTTRTSTTGLAPAGRRDHVVDEPGAALRATLPGLAHAGEAHEPVGGLHLDDVVVVTLERDPFLAAPARPAWVVTWTRGSYRTCPPYSSAKSSSGATFSRR